MKASIVVSAIIAEQKNRITQSLDKCLISSLDIEFSFFGNKMPVMNIIITNGINPKPTFHAAHTVAFNRLRRQAGDMMLYCFIDKVHAFIFHLSDDLVMVVGTGNE